jgi:hypothetical protein
LVIAEGGVSKMGRAKGHQVIAVGAALALMALNGCAKMGAFYSCNYHARMHHKAYEDVMFFAGAAGGALGGAIVDSTDGGKTAEEQITDETNACLVAQGYAPMQE